MTCHPCRHWICETVRVHGGTWAVWKCPERKVEFGNERDWKEKRAKEHKCRSFEVRII